MGSLWSYLAQSFPPKSQFTVDEIPDLTGRVILVTGGNGGIGYEIIKVLLTKNAKVYMLSRSKERAEAAISRLKSETGKEALFIQLDLADLDSVRKAVDEFKSKETQVDVLFNNGGVMNTPIEQLTTQGFDMQFGTNVIGHYVLTKRLLPLLMAGAQSSPDKKARVVHQSSSAQLFVDTIDLEALTDGPARRKLGKEKIYMQSKFANVVLSNELARRYGDKGLVSASGNPGNLKTDLQRHTPGAFMMLFGWLFSPAPFGALTPLYAGVSPASVDLNGKYLIPWARVGAMRKEAADPKLGEQLWNWLEEHTKE
ncbi:NAD(P)-binding protein [Mycena epipterygia]|nr:NAD(P)-binding protein [Mycena epipterygia]